MVKTENKLLKKVCILGLSATMLAGMVLPMSDSFRKDTVITQADTSYDGEFSYGGKTYKYKNDGTDKIMLMSVTAGGELKIPSTVTIGGKKKTVSKLGEWFGAYQTFTKVVVPDTVTIIERRVFYAATMDSLKLSVNLESTGEWFASSSNVSSVECKSTKLNNLGDYCFYLNKGAEKIILGKYLVKLEANGNVLDLSTSDLTNVKEIYRGIRFDMTNVDTIKFGKTTFEIPSAYYVLNNSKLKNVYVNGTKVVCKSAKDILPDIVRKYYLLIEKSDFEYNYSADKAKYVITGLGHKYYGLNNKKKGTLPVEEEFDIALDLHDYIVENYEYDTKKTKGPYTRVFNCHEYSKCAYDGQMYAFLLECAGVEAETISSAELIPVTEAQKKQYEAEGKKYSYTLNGKYRIGKYGNHMWTLIKIGGQWTHVDATTDRQINGYGCSLVSNMFDSEGIHCFPHFSEYANDEYTKKFYAFQNYSTMLTTPKETQYKGDLDKSGKWYRDTKDLQLLTSFIVQSDEDREMIRKAKGGALSITDKKAQSLNSGYTSGGVHIDVKLVEKRNGKWYSLIDADAADINFDNKYDVRDIMFMQRLFSKVDKNK